MKRYLCFVSLAGLALANIALAAGPVLNSTDLAPVGTTYQAYSVTIPAQTKINPGNAGADQTWDFSSLYDSATITIQVVDGATVPQVFHDSLPNANRWEKNNTGHSGNYSAYQLSSTDLKQIAVSVSYDSSKSALSYGLHYTRPVTVCHFPLSYGDVLTDSAQPVGRPLMTLTGSYDGYGTLITPHGTYTNVIRTTTVASNGHVAWRWSASNPCWTILQITDSTSVTLYSLAPTSIDHRQATKPISYQLYGTPTFSLFDILGRWQGNASPSKRYNGILVQVAADGRVKLINPFAEGR